MPTSLEGRPGLSYKIFSDDNEGPVDSHLYLDIFPSMGLRTDYRATNYCKKDEFFKILDDLFPNAGYYVVFDSIDQYKRRLVLAIPDVKWLIDLYLSVGDTNHDRIKSAIESPTSMEPISLAEVRELYDVTDLEFDDEIDPEDIEDFVEHTPNSPTVIPYTREEDFRIVTGCYIMTPVSDPYIDKFHIAYDLVKYPEVKVKSKDFVFTLGQGGSGLILNKHSLDNSSYGIDIIKHNYNDDFEKVYDRLLEFLESDESGLVLFKGEAGTGKTSLLLHLTHISEELGKRVVFIPSAFASVLADPGFLTFASQQLNNTILVLEDAEEALLSRDRANGSAVTNILNISDGILGKILKTKVIATVNKQEALDDALFRKGRLKLEYIFKPLEVDKANKLLERLGNEKRVNVPTTLANLYNINSEPKMNEEKPIARIGFSR